MEGLLSNVWFLVAFAVLVGVGVPAGITVWWRNKNDPYVRQQARRKKYKRRHRPSH